MQSIMSMSVLRSAARRAAGSCSRRGLATAAEKESVGALVQKEVRSQLRAKEAARAKAERESVAALVQQEVRSQLRAEEARRAMAERESVSALIQREVRDRLREEESARADGEWRVYMRSLEEAAEERGTDWLGSWKDGFFLGAVCGLGGIAYWQLIFWVMK